MLIEKKSSMNTPTISQEYRRFITTKRQWFRAQYQQDLK